MGKIERTVLIVKPEHLHIGEIILGELDEVGKRIVTVRVDDVPEDMARKHYEPLKDRFYYEWLVDSFKGKSILLTLYEGENIVDDISKKVGPTDPALAPKDTIRGKYSNDSLEKAIKEKRAAATVVHRSESRAEANREMNVWSAYLGIKNIEEFYNVV